MDKAHFGKQYMNKPDDVNSNGEVQFTPLEYAILYNDFDAVVDLVNMGADYNLPTKYKERPLQYAVGAKDLRILRYLLALPNIVIDSFNIFHGFNPLIKAMRSKHHTLESAELLIAAGIDIQHKDNNGMNAYHHAVMMGLDQNIIDLLIKHGINTTCELKVDQNAPVLDQIMMCRNIGQMMSNIDKYTNSDGK